jgi:tetratricopeptide (TPR) repeat protein
VRKEEGGDYVKSHSVVHLLLLALLLALMFATLRCAHSAPLSQEDTAEALFEQADAKFDAEAYADAIILLQEVLNQSPDSELAEEAQMLLAVSYYNLQENRRAIAEFSRLLKDYPNSKHAPTALFMVGMSHFNLQENKQAIAELTKLLKEYPDYEYAPAALLTIGNCHYRLGSFEGAKIALEALIAGYPDSEFVDDAREILQSIKEDKIPLTSVDVDDPCGLLNHNGMTLFRQARYSEALPTLEYALACYRALGDRPGEGTTLSNIGGVYLNRGQYREAMDYFQQALTIQHEIGDRAGEGTTLSNIGGVYDSMGQHEEALDYYEQALSIAQEINDRASEGRNLNNIGSIYDKLGKYEEALDYYKRALAIRQEVDDRVGEGISFNNIGMIHHILGQYPEALDYYNRALDILQGVDDRAGESKTLTNIGSIYDLWGQYEESLKYHKRALTIARESGDRAGESAILNNIGFIYYSLGQYEEVVDCWVQSLAITQEIGNRVGEGYLLSSIGFIYYVIGQYEDALNYCERALSISLETGDHILETGSLSNIGVIYTALGQYEQALNHYELALSVQLETGYNPELVATLSGIGELYTILGQYERALDRHKQALRIAQEIGHRADEAIISNNIGYVCYQLGRYKEALDYYEQAVSIVETMRGEMTVEETKSGFVAGQVHVYDDVISLLIQMKCPDEAFGYVQRAKARAFLDQLANVHIDPRATDDPELLAHEQDLLGQIHALESILFGHSDLAPLNDTTQGSLFSLTGELRTAAQARLEAAYREYEQLLIEIKLSNPQYASLRSVQASNLITVQQTLPPGVTFLEYYVAPTQTLAFVITQDDFEAVPISVTEKALSDSINWFRQFPSLDGVPQVSQELYNLLFDPVRGYIHTNALYIAPHSILHYLPFGALHDGTRYLVEDYAIAYLPSASVLQYISANVHDDVNGNLLAFCNPEAERSPDLRHAVAETEAIAALFDTRAIVGPDATETRFIAQAPQASRVHIAAHGQFNSIAPQFSRIFLAPDDQNDGYLEVHEIFNLELPQADLVTLSACETQLGELSVGDEVVGLSRAFIYAGTPSLVATLWSVDDVSTRFLMECFYSYLEEGQSKVSALRQAQLDTMEEYPSPYYWAPFTLIGDMGGPRP